MLKLLFQNYHWYNSILLQLLVQEIKGVPLFLEEQLVTKSCASATSCLQIWLRVASHSVFCDLLQLVVDAFSFSHLLGLKAFAKKMVQISSFASKAEGRGISILCVCFHGECYSCLQLHLPVAAH